MKYHRIYSLIALLTPTLCWADLTVVRSIKLESPKLDGTVRARGMMQLHDNELRRETEVHADGVLSSGFLHTPLAITLISLEKGQIHRFDSQQQGFQKFSMSQWKKYLEDRSVESEKITASPYQINQTWSRVFPSEEVKMVRGLPCRKFAYEWRFQIENPETYEKREYKVLTTLWLADISSSLQQTLQEERAFKAAYHKKVGGAPLEDLNGITLQFAEMITGVDKHTLYSAIGQGTSRLPRIVGYPMASDTEWQLLSSKSNKSLFKVHAQLESLSLQPIPQTVFKPSIRPLTDIDEDAQLLSQAR